MTEQTASAATTRPVSEADPQDRSIIVDSWNVPDGFQDEFMDALIGLFERLREFDGFLDGQILEGADRTRFVSYATMRSTRERDLAMADGELRAAARRIGGIAHPQPHAYRIVRTFMPPASERAR